MTENFATESAIEIQNLYKSFGHVSVLNDISLAQRRGEVARRLDDRIADGDVA